ncbi:MAG: hypothetical protein ACRDGH_09985 [Candidatus Limnocylindria bacterium]
MATDDERARAQELHSTLTKHMLLRRLGVLLGSTGEIAYPAISTSHRGQPSDGSPMAADIKEVTADVVGNVQRVCAAWHVVTAEHLQAVESVHADGHLLFAAGPLLRSVMEHAARVGWVLGGLTATARAARSWLAIVVSNGEDVITHRNRGDPSPTLAGAPARLEALCEQTLPNLFAGERPDCSSGRTSQWTFLGQERGSNTQIAEDFFARRVHPRWGPKTSGRVQYRVATMFAHPSTTATFALADQEPGSAEFRWDWQHTRTRVISALACFQVVTLDLYGYVGWRPPELAAWNDHFARFVAETNPRGPEAEAEPR